MKKSFSQSVSDSLFNRNKAPGLNELRAVMSLDDDLCALLESESNSLIYINSKMIRFSGFSNEEIEEKPAAFLFPDLNLSEIISGESRVLLVNRKNQAALGLEAHLNYLDSNTRWLRIKFIDPTRETGRVEINETELLQKLLSISTLIDQENFNLALEKSAEIIHEVTGAEGTAIYWIGADSPQFTRIACAGIGNQFPESLPLVDSDRLIPTQIWTPAQRVLTDIHKFGRMNGYSHIASSSIGDDKPAINSVLGAKVDTEEDSIERSTETLIVCGGKGSCPSQLNEKMMTTIAAQVQSLQQHYLMVDYLQRENRSLIQMINRLDTVFSNINEGVILLTADLAIQHINPAAEWILGYSSQEVEGQDYANILIGTDRLSPAVEEARKGIPTHNTGKVTFNRRDGQPFPAIVQVVPVLIKGQLIAIEILLSDISENENNKAVVQHLEHRAVLGDYTSAFAHDIRNPINNISLGIQRINNKFPAEDPMREVIAGIQNDCTRLNHLMESFLTYARSSDLHLEEIEIGPFLKKTLDRWHPRLSNAHISSYLHIGEKVDKIKGDPRALDRVFTNLISNAVDAMSASGDSLAINAELNTSSADLPMVEITVSDNGPGIPDDMKERIFEPFVSTSQKGTGLGLAITKEIVTAHKGSIKVNSFPGGTNFIVSIPAINGDSK